MTLLRIADELSASLGSLTFAQPITHVYNPLQYARAPYAQYLERFAQGTKEVLFLGMNPGPFGMAQTGVPFGEVSLVCDWLGIRGEVGKPDPEHSKRPIEGFACPRSEVSGARLWGWVRERFETPAAFFDRFLILNYCPLVFLEASGRNFTPDKLPARERGPLFAACDAALRQSVELVAPRVVVGIGAFAERRAREALPGLDLEVGTILHPSPASPAANRGWAEQAESQLAALGVVL